MSRVALRSMTYWLSDLSIFSIFECKCFIFEFNSVASFTSFLNFAEISFEIYSNSYFAYDI